MNLNIIKVIFFKELLDAFRDRRTIMIMVATPLLFPLVMILFSVTTVEQIETVYKEEAKVGIIGDENAPELKEWIEANETFVILEVSSDYNTSLNSGDIEAVLIIPKDFNVSLACESKANLTIIYDSTRLRSTAAATKFIETIRDYNRTIVSRRLSDHGLDDQIHNPIKLSFDDVAPQQKSESMMLALMLPIILTMWIVSGGMNTAVDITAGEKERRTLEALLVTPPSRMELVMGKFLTVFTITMINIVLILVSIIPLVIASSLFFSSPDATISSEGILLIIGVMVLLAVFINSIQLTIGVFAKSAKEAQQYFTPLIFLILLPVLFLPFFSITGEAIPTLFFFVPVLNVTFLMQQVILGDMITYNIVVTFVTTGIYAAVCFYMTMRAFSQEGVLFRT